MKNPSLAVLVATGLWGSVLAQDGEYATGYQRESDEVFQSYPSVPRYRAFLPVKADLSFAMPRPGAQGKQGSCTAWAVGYAMRTMTGANIGPSFLAGRMFAT